MWIDEFFELLYSKDSAKIEEAYELKKYASKGDKNYVLKLKENTNFYPNSPTDKNYQIKQASLFLIS